MRLHQWDVFIGGGMENGGDVVRFENFAQAAHIENRAYFRPEYDARKGILQFALDEEKARLGSVKANNQLGTEARDLAEKSRSDRARRAADQNHLVSELCAHVCVLEHHLRTAQEIFDCYVANGRELAILLHVFQKSRDCAKRKFSVGAV